MRGRGGFAQGLPGSTFWSLVAQDPLWVLVAAELNHPGTAPTVHGVDIPPRGWSDDYLMALADEAALVQHFDHARRRRDRRVEHHRAAALADEADPARVLALRATRRGGIDALSQRDGSTLARRRDGATLSRAPALSACSRALRMMTSPGR